MKINHRHYILTFFAFLSIIAASLAYFFLYKQTTIQANNHLTVLKQKELEKNSAEYEESLLLTFNKYEEERAKIQSYIVKEDDLVKFIERVEKIGTDSKTELEISSIGSTDNKIRARVTAEGSWSNVMTALMMIEDLPISMFVSNVRMENISNLEKTVSKTPPPSSWRLILDIEALTTT